MPHFDKKYFSDDHSLNILPFDIQPFNALKGKTSQELRNCPMGKESLY